MSEGDAPSMMREGPDSSGDDRGDAAQAPSWASRGSYSSALSKSMRKIITARPRMMGLRGAAAGIGISSASAAGGGLEDGELLARFAAAVEARAKDEMVSLLSRHPQLARVQNEDDQLALHLVCGLAPNYFYVDVIEMLVQGNAESPACMDTAGQTPLHLLCLNPTVTCQGLAALLAALPAAAAMVDKRSNLPLHYVCMNPKCDVEMLRQVGQADTFAIRNEHRQTPLHCLGMGSRRLPKAAFLHLLRCCGEAAAVIDVYGRTVLHYVCEADGVDAGVLDAVLSAMGPTPSLSYADTHQDLPLHLLCQNPSVDAEMLKRLLHGHTEAVTARTENDLTAIHLLCANEAVNADLLSEILVLDKAQTLAALPDAFGATALHMLCMNEAISAETLRALLLFCTDESFRQDVHGRSPLHYVCMNTAVASEMIWLFLERAQQLVREIDVDGKTPLHHLCANKSLTPTTLEVLFDACPSAAMIADAELRLPIQYLVDNPSSPPETTALLVSGPSSYRLRYDFLHVVRGHSTSFVVNQEQTHLQTNLAMDSRESTKVWIKFFSSTSAWEHEHAILTRLSTVARRPTPQCEVGQPTWCLGLLDEFDDAKRRVTIRSAAAVAPEDQIGDSSVTLHFGLVVEAPTYTLDSLTSTEKLDDLDQARVIIADVGSCLEFWHREAMMVHGNVSLECVGHFANKGYRLVHFHTSREYHERRSMGVHAVNVACCPPEAARALLTGECFEPTTQSDVWQFGCLIYHLATGTSLLSSLVPWSEKLGSPQLLHLISALTDDVIHDAIAAIDPSLQSLLRSTLVVNPAHRWGIERLMHIDAFRVEQPTTSVGVASVDKIHTRLQRRAEAEMLNAKNQRHAKHTEEQLEFIKTEQAALRGQLLLARTQLRESEDTCATLRAEATELRDQLATLGRQRNEARQEVRVFARNHQTMTNQLHTTMEMLVSLVPLAKKVYGTGADEFLSSLLAEAAGAESTSLSTIDISEGLAGTPREDQQHYQQPTRRRRPSAVAMVKRQLQNSILAHGCIHTWAHSSPPAPILEPYELSYGSSSGSSSDLSVDMEGTEDGDGHDDNDKPPPDDDTTATEDAPKGPAPLAVGDNQLEHLVESSSPSPLPFARDCFLIPTDECDDLLRP